MKKNHHIGLAIIGLLLLAGVMLMQSCKPNQLIPFEEADAVYFGSPTVFGQASMTTSYSFAKYPNKTVDTFWLPISLVGQPAGQDREIVIEPVDSSIVNASNGKEYKLIPPYKLPANQVATSIPVLLIRTGPMDSLVYTVVLRIKSSNELKAGIAAQSQYRINIAFLQKPTDWDIYNGSEGWAKYSNNFGTWTRTKYKLVLDALYSPSGDTSITNFPGSRFQPPAIFNQYRQIVKNYILTNYPGNYSTPLGIGPTLRDPDANNEVIQVAPANY